MIQELDGNTKCISLTEYDEDTHRIHTCMYIDVEKGNMFNPNEMYYFRGLQCSILSDDNNTVFISFGGIGGIVRFYGYVGFDTTITPIFCKFPDNWADLGIDPSNETTLAEYAEKNLQLGRSFAYPDSTMKPKIEGYYNPNK